MSTLTDPIPHTRNGIEGWLQPSTGRWLPRLAGADDEAEAAAKAAEEAAAAEAAAKQAEEEAAAKSKDGELGPGGKAALEAERKERKAAEKRAKDAEAALKAKEEAELTEVERLKKQAEDAEGKVTAATEKLRRANLITALADEGLSGARAKAAAKLLDDVEYDEDDEPTNLADAMKAAKAEYGDDIFKGAKPKAPKTNGGEGNEDREGPTLTADELAAAKAAGMTPEEYEQYKSPQPKVAATTT